MKKKSVEDKQRIRSVDKYIQQIAYYRDFEDIKYKKIILYSDLLRNIKKYDKNIYAQIIKKENSTRPEQKKEVQTLVKPLETAYKNYLKTQFTVVKYRSSSVPKKILEQITDESTEKLCRGEMSNFSNDLVKNSDFVFISKSGTSHKPVVGGFALVSKHKTKVYVDFLCSHMGQGSAILDAIRNWIVLTNLDKMITKLELTPLDSAIPFYKKYGLTHNIIYDGDLMSSDTLNCIIPKNMNIKTPEDAAKIVKFNYKLYKTLPEIYKENEKVLTELAGYSPYNFNSFLPLSKFKRLLKYKIENDPKSVENVLKKNGKILEFFSDEIRGNEEMVKIAISQYAWAIQFASEELKANKRIVEYAIDKGNGSVIIYASEALQDNEQLVRKAVETNGIALKYASEKLRNNERIVEIAVNNKATSFEYATEEMRKNQDLVLKLIGKKWYKAGIIKYISNTLKENKDFILKAVEQNPYVIEYVSFPMKRNKDVLLKAVESNGMLLSYTSSQLKNDEEVVLKAVKNNGTALRFASTKLKNDKEIVRTAILNAEVIFSEIGSPFEYASDTLKADKQFVESLLNENTLTDIDKKGLLHFANTKVKQ